MILLPMQSPHIHLVCCVIVSGSHVCASPKPAVCLLLFFFQGGTDPGLLSALPRLHPHPHHQPSPSTVTPGRSAFAVISPVSVNEPMPDSLPVDHKPIPLVGSLSMPLSDILAWCSELQASYSEHNAVLIAKGASAAALTAASALDCVAAAHVEVADRQCQVAWWNYLELLGRVYADLHPSSDPGTAGDSSSQAKGKRVACFASPDDGIDEFGVDRVSAEDEDDGDDDGDGDALMLL